MTTPLDIEAFLDRTLFSLDTLVMLRDVEDFIDFSEDNIAWQKRRELRRAERDCDDEHFDDPHFAVQYRDQTIQ